MPPLPADTRRLRRSAEGRLLGGVCRGLSMHLGVDVWLLRLTFALFALLDGSGVAAYAAFWLFVPLGVIPAAERSKPRASLRVAVIAIMGIGLILFIGLNGPGRLHPGHKSLALSFAVVAAGLAVLWRQIDDSQRARWFAARDRPRLSDFARGATGALIVFGGILGLVANSSSWPVVGRTVLAAFALLAGMVLIALPFLMRTWRDLNTERSERIRSQERAEVAAIMHDSVLHTLALIQRKSGDAAEVARLARAQERDLRLWLYGDAPRPGGEEAQQTFAQAIKAAAAGVEDRHGVQVDVVTVGDADLDDALRACVAAAREAAVNAAKYAAGAQISVYAEVESADRRATSVEVFVRDRGPGFDLDAVAQDRMGIRESILGRMKRHGGRATIRTGPGEGTEVHLELRRD
jgi:signal transduction histidine kinase